MDDKIDVAATLFLRPDETAAAFLSRIRHPGLRTTIPLLDRCLGSRQGTILEIVGPPGSGKSTLLYMIAANNILIPQIQEWENRLGSVLFFDLNGKFDMHCMLRIMRQEVKCLSQKYNLSCHQEDSIITRALKQLKIIPCPSSFHFLAVLDKLERDSVTNFPTLNACIIVDDLSAHMHVDRVGFGFNKPYSSGRSSTESSTQSSYQNMKVVYASILRKLNNLQQMLEAPIIMTTRMRTELSSGQGSRRAKLQPWDEEVTHVIQILPARDEEESSSVTTMQWLKPFSTSVERLSLLK